MYPNLLTQTSVYSPLLRCAMPLVSSPLSPAASPPVSSSFLVDNILRDRAAAATFLARPVPVSACSPDHSGGGCTACPGCVTGGGGAPGKGRCQNGGQGDGGGGTTPYLKFGVSAILAAESKEKMTARNVLAVSGEC